MEKKLPPIIQSLVDKLEAQNMKITFGLEQQGHIDTIEKMIDEYSTERGGLSSSVHLWTKIANKIGWDCKIAMAHYIHYLRTQKQNK